MVKMGSLFLLNFSTSEIMIFNSYQDHKVNNYSSYFKKKNSLKFTQKESNNHG